MSSGGESRPLAHLELVGGGTWCSWLSAEVPTRRVGLVELVQRDVFRERKEGCRLRLVKCLGRGYFHGFESLGFCFNDEWFDIKVHYAKSGKLSSSSNLKIISLV